MGIGRVFGAAIGHGGAGYDYPIEKIFVRPLNKSAAVKWTDPCDNGWLGTKIVRKTGTYPASVIDGTLVVDSRVRNQYTEDGFVDTGLTNGTEYYYKAFPYSGKGVNTSYLNQAAPVMPFTFSFTGTYEDTNITANEQEYRLITLKSSGTLTVSALTADIWMCGGGAAGSTRGGGGGYTTKASSINLLGSYVLTIGTGGVGNGVNGGNTSGFGLTANGGQSTSGAGGSGGGARSSGTVGAGAGISTVPFGFTSVFSPHCAGGGGGGYSYEDRSDNYSSNYRGGKGGSDGASGSTGLSGYSTGGDGGTLGGGKGGNGTTGNANIGSSATYYGSGGGGYGYYYYYFSSSNNTSASGTPGSGYQGVIYLLIK